MISSFCPTLPGLPALRPVLTPNLRLLLTLSSGVLCVCVNPATSERFLSIKTCSNTLQLRLKKTFAISSRPRLPLRCVQPQE